MITDKTIKQAIYNINKRNSNKFNFLSFMYGLFIGLLVFTLWVIINV